MNTAFGFPCPFNVRPRLSEVAPGRRKIPGRMVVPFPITLPKVESVIAALNVLYAKRRSAAHCVLAPSPSCITPFTFPKLVLEPLFVPTLPVRCVRYL